MFLDYYGFREQPFGVTPNPRYLYYSPAHREALASLIYSIEADLGFSALIAEPGMGKTTLLYYLLEKLRSAARTALIFQTQCSPLDLLRYLASEFEIPVDSTDPVLLNDRIREMLIQEVHAGRRVVVVVDEAQNLSDEVLETIRLLSNFETPKAKLLQIILSGQPQLASKLSKPGMSQLLQRIAILSRLTPLTPQDIRNYIEYRVGIAGYRGPNLFSQDAMTAIAQLSAGVPRNINRICFNALSTGCALRKRLIDAAVIDEVRADLDVTETFSRPDPSPLSKGAADSTARDATATSNSRDIPHWSSTTSEPSFRQSTVTARPAEHSPIASSPTFSALRQSHQASPVATMPRVSQLGAAAYRPPPAQIRTETATARQIAPSASQPSVDGGSKREVTGSRGRQHQPTGGYRVLPITALIVGTCLLAGWGIWQKLPPHAGTDSAPTQKQSIADNFSLAEGTSAGATTTPRKQTSSVLPQSDVAMSTRSTPVVNSPPPSELNAQPAMLLKRFPPSYPHAAQEAGIQGKVILAAVIGKDGRVKNVHALSGNALLADAAVDAVRKWVYRPYILNGEPQDIDTRVVVDFEIPQQQ